MNASNKRRINEKKCGVCSRAAFNNTFAVPAAFIRGRRLFEGGVYSSNYGTYTNCTIEDFFITMAQTFKSRLPKSRREKKVETREK